MYKKKTNKNIKKIRRSKTKRRTMNKWKGGENGQIPNYAINTWQHDPNYMQISSRNIMQHGSGKRKTKKGGSVFDFASGQLSNPISSFFTSNSGSWFGSNSVASNNAPYIQPIGVRQYTSP